MRGGGALGVLFVSIALAEVCAAGVPSESGAFDFESPPITFPKANAPDAPAPPSAAPAVPAGARYLTLEQCVASALMGNLDIIAANEELHVAEATRKSARGGLFPRLHVDASISQYKGAYSAQVGGGAGFPVRDATTGQVTLQLIQPLTALWPLYEHLSVQALGVDVAKIQRDATVRDTALQVLELFYRVIQAEGLEGISRSSVSQLEAQLERAQSFERAGQVGRGDALRAQVALATARQKLIQARGTTQVFRGRLATMIGLRPSEVIVPKSPPIEPTRYVAPSMGEVENRALSGRVEIRELLLRIDEARAQKRGALAGLFPSINAVAAMQATKGQRIVEETSAYVGGVLSWDIFDWGKTYYGIDSAAAQHTKAEAALHRMQGIVQLDARSAHVAFSSAKEGLAVVQAAVSQADDNFRTQRRRYDQHAATSFDVIDAESLLTQARGQAETALYDYVIAYATLARAMGEPYAGVKLRESTP